MEPETFMLWIALPFGAAAGLMWLCYRIAVGKGRSGWWALLGLLHIVGIEMALMLDSWPKPRKGAKRVRADGDQTGAAGVERPQAEAEAGAPHLERRGRAWQELRRPSDWVAYKLFGLSLIMYGLAFVGPIVFLVGLWHLLTGKPSLPNGQPTHSITARLVFLGVTLGLSACGVLFIIVHRRYLAKRREVYDIRKRRASRDRSARRE